MLPGAAGLEEAGFNWTGSFLVWAGTGGLDPLLGLTWIVVEVEFVVWLFVPDEDEGDDDDEAEEEEDEEDELEERVILVVVEPLAEEEEVDGGDVVLFEPLAEDDDEEVDCEPLAEEDDEDEEEDEVVDEFLGVIVVVLEVLSWSKSFLFSSSALWRLDSAWANWVLISWSVTKILANSV